MKEEKNVEVKDLYDPILKSNAIKDLIYNKKKYRIATVFLYERVGNQDVFEGTYSLMKGAKTKIFGEYCILEYKGRSVFVDVPSSDDFILSNDNKIKKIIEFVKFADDDFRILKRLNKNFFYKSKVPKMKTINEKDEETGEEYSIKVQEVDKEGNLLYEDVEKEYVEPKGITQEARDVIRQGNEYERKKEEYRKKNQSFLEKYKEIIVPVTTLAICFLMLVVTLKFSFDGVNSAIDSIDELVDTVNEKPWYADEETINKIASRSNELKDEEGNPPT